MKRHRSPQPLEIDLVRPEDLSVERVARWSELQLADPALRSPFFRPELALTAGRLRRGAEVAVVLRDGEAAGFFPFERHRGGIGRPVGGALSDYHGIVAAPGLEVDPLQVVRACGLRAWDFDHVPSVQAGFEPHSTAVSDSPCVDLATGYDAWERGRRAAGSSVVVKQARKARVLARDVGALRFTAESHDAEAFAQLLSWKSAQYRTTGKLDLLASEPVVALLDHLRLEQGAEFSGMLSTLYAGDELVAVHFGLRTRTVWHSLMPAYDPAFSGHSPGLLLLLEMTRAAEGLGIQVIDLGRGGESYKQRLATSSVPLLEGSVSRSRAHTAGQAIKTRVDGAARRSRAGAAILEGARQVKLGLAARRGRAS